MKTRSSSEEDNEDEDRGYNSIRGTAMAYPSATGLYNSHALAALLCPPFARFERLVFLKRLFLLRKMNALLARQVPAAAFSSAAAATTSSCAPIK